MSVTGYESGDQFTIRVTKFHQLNPDNKWANSYEFQAEAAGAEDELLTLGQAVVEFEAALHRNVVIFDRILISTWQPDSKPYNPEVFISSTLTAVGGRGTDADNLPLNQTLAVARIAGFGRFGHLFYRGVLDEEDVSAPAGKQVLDDRAGIQTMIDAAIVSSGLEDYLGATSTRVLKMVMISADGAQSRDIIQLRAQGVSAVPQDHAWFNRTTTPAP
jgi:hypothetical protein